MRVQGGRVEHVLVDPVHAREDEEAGPRRRRDQRQGQGHQQHHSRGVLGPGQGPQRPHRLLHHRVHEPGREGREEERRVHPPLLGPAPNGRGEQQLPDQESQPRQVQPSDEVDLVGRGRPFLRRGALLHRSRRLRPRHPGRVARALRPRHDVRRAVRRVAAPSQEEEPGEADREREPRLHRDQVRDRRVGGAQGERGDLERARPRQFRDGVQGCLRQDHTGRHQDDLEDGQPEGEERVSERGFRDEELLHLPHNQADRGGLDRESAVRDHGVDGERGSEDLPQTDPRHPPRAGHVQDHEDGSRDSRRDGLLGVEEVRSSGPGREELHGFQGSGVQDRGLRHGEGRLRDGLLQDREEGVAADQVDGARESVGRRVHVRLGRVVVRRRPLRDPHPRRDPVPGFLERGGAQPRAAQGDVERAPRLPREHSEDHGEVLQVAAQRSADLHGDRVRARAVPRPGFLREVVLPLDGGRGEPQLGPQEALPPRGPYPIPLGQRDGQVGEGVRGQRDAVGSDQGRDQQGAHLQKRFPALW